MRTFTAAAKTASTEGNHRSSSRVGLSLTSPLPEGEKDGADEENFLHEDDARVDNDSDNDHNSSTDNNDSHSNDSSTLETEGEKRAEKISRRRRWAERARNRTTKTTASPTSSSSSSSALALPSSSLSVSASIVESDRGGRGRHRQRGGLSGSRLLREESFFAVNEKYVWSSGVSTFRGKKGMLMLTTKRLIFMVCRTPM